MYNKENQSTQPNRNNSNNYRDNRNNKNRNFKNNRQRTYQDNKPKEVTPESIKRNKNIIKKVEEWQDFKFIKHLTCNTEGCETKLRAKEVNGRVILQCPKCRSIQSYIPKAVLQTTFYVSTVLKRLQSMYHTLLNFESTRSGTHN